MDTVMNKKIVITVVVSVACTVLLGFAILARLAESQLEVISNQRVSSVLTVLEKEQSRLGVLCLDGDEAILKYIDAVAPIARNLKDGKRLSVSNPIFELGERTADVVNTCGLLRNMLEEVNNHTLSNLALGEDMARQEFVIVRLAMSRTAAMWCKADCILDAKKKIEESSLLLRQKLRLKVQD